MVTWERVTEIARQLPEIEETSSLASPAYLLIWLEHIDEDEVRERLIDGWLLQAPRRLAAQHEFD